MGVVRAPPPQSPLPSYPILSYPISSPPQSPLPSYPLLSPPLPAYPTLQKFIVLDIEGTTTPIFSPTPRLSPPSLPFLSPFSPPLPLSPAPLTPPHLPPALQKFIVLDIEGTTTPISFVSQVLFPYAKSHVGQHLLATFDTPETQADMLLLRTQIDEDVKSSIPGAEPVPPSEAGKEAVVGAVERNVAAMIAADRKVTALKQLQGHIWRGGYEKGELKGEFFSDVLTALTQWHAAGCKIYIYSSGSREAQHLIFGYSNVGDLRRFISGFFDTTTGHKREARSYSEIALTLGADSPSHITFCTDILEEAQAAKQAGLQAVLLSRPGNGALPADPGFPVLTSLTDL
ncbi:unnamed protein product [Closterium sp. NIES-53]